MRGWVVALVVLLSGCATYNVDRRRIEIKLTDRVEIHTHGHEFTIVRRF